ncbi:MAG: hypothetical protein HKN95_13025 [Acidimicrobiia bacterium]|nr:hypothetical protein [Acidimicrobiia bacterium]
MSSIAVPSPSDEAQVETAARDYVEGWYAGDVDRMNRALHTDLVKRIPDADGSGSLREVSKARMIELTAQGGGDLVDAEFEVFIDDISIDIACVRVVSPEYLDYLHLAKTSDGWKIANVLFHLRG